MGNTVPVPLLVENKKFKAEMNLFLKEAHERTKRKVTEMRKSGNGVKPAETAAKAKPVVKMEPVDKKLLQEPKGIPLIDKHYFYSEQISEFYRRRDEDQKYLEMAITACEAQIAIAKQVAEEELKGEKLFIFKTGEEIYEQFKKDMAEDLAIIEGSDKQKAMLEAIDRLAGECSDGLKKPDNSQLHMEYGGTTFDPNIHKSKDDFVIVPGELGIHIGYNRLCIIREKQGNWQEVIRLAEQAKSEGWVGDWDKRIEKARKKLGK